MTDNTGPICDVFPFARYIEKRLTPEKTSEFWGYLYGTSGPSKPCDIFTADQVQGIIAADRARLIEMITPELIKDLKNASRDLNEYARFAGSYAVRSAIEILQAQQREIESLKFQLQPQGPGHAPY